MSDDSDIQIVPENTDSKPYVSAETVDLNKFFNAQGLKSSFSINDSLVDEKHLYFADVLISQLIINNPKVLLVALGVLGLFIKKFYSNKIVKIKGVKLGNKVIIENIEGNADKVKEVIDQAIKENT